ncbi:ABC transporter permease [Dellaglioa algida]|uniref:ABC transporter permease n=1 Tax=Dellaglioa algida TaxID=105612 RepID=UPI0024C4D3D9|nr:ABC transporter permease [Dellaglioa algida]MDK1726829.1 ABC transporter permease [Dellaglioa algida]
MRTLVIAKRVLTELLRDKRSLALIFIAPLLVLTLMSFAFNNNSTQSTKIGTVSVSKIFNQKLDQKNIIIKKYATISQAKAALKKDQIDSYINQSGQKLSATYANVDASKTAATKMAIKTAAGSIQQEKIENELTTLTKNLPESPKLNVAQPLSLKNYYIYGDKNTSYFDKMLPILMGFFVFFFIFLISGMSLLKERTSGTLDRLLATPVKRSEIVFGYMLSYSVLAFLQTILIVLFTVKVLSVDILGNIWSVIIINLLLSLVALAFGILMSTFAKSEFQLMQFIPIIVLPQVFLSGIISLDSMPQWLQYFSYILPMRYAGEALTGVIMHGYHLLTVWPMLVALLIFLIVLLILNIIGLKRYRKV